MLNKLDPDQDRHSVSPDLGPNCLQRLSEDNKVNISNERVNEHTCILYKYVGSKITKFIYPIYPILLPLIDDLFFFSMRVKYIKENIIKEYGRK